MKGLVALALATAFVLAGCYTGPNAEHYLAVLGEVRAPADWRLVDGSLSGPGEEVNCEPFTSAACPGARRRYVTEGDAAQAFAQAKDMVAAAGFAITDELDPACDGASGAAACALFSERDGDQISVYILHSGDQVGIPDAPRGRAAVVIEAHRAL